MKSGRTDAAVARLRPRAQMDRRGQRLGNTCELLARSAAYRQGRWPPPVPRRAVAETGRISPTSRRPDDLGGMSFVPRRPLGGTGISSRIQASAEDRKSR